MNSLGKILFALVFAAAGLAPMTRADAAQLIFDYSFSFGAVPSDGTAPWLRAVFEDTGANTVRLTLTALDLSTDDGGVGATPEYADEWWFNLDPALAASGITFTYVSGETATAIITSANASGNDLKADGDGFYDFRLNFDATHLSDGETSVYDLTMAGLDALDFNFLSDPSGGAGVFLAAAHIQSTGVENLGSDFVAPAPVPAPPTLPLLLLPLLGWFVFASRRR